MRRALTTTLMTLGLAGAVAPTEAHAAPEPYPRNLLGREVVRSGFHFQFVIGFGGGPDTEGIYHAMEIGGTFHNGMTLALLHTFIQNKKVFRDKGGPDLIGGWLVEFKTPIHYPEIVAKIAIGPGGKHIQGKPLKAVWGPTWAYGLDFHVPVTRGTGPTLSFQGLHTVVEGTHHVGFGGGLGYTVF